MKKCNYIFIIALLLLMLFIVACGDDIYDDDINDNNANVGIEDIDNTIIENYFFLPQPIELPATPYPVAGATVRGEHIIYWYVDYSISQLAIVELTPDGSVVEELHIPLSAGTIQVAGLQTTENNHFEFISVVNDIDDGITVSYDVYNQQGENISTLDISHTVPPGALRFIVSQAVFTDDGNIALAVMDGGYSSQLYLLSDEGARIGQLQTNIGSSIIRLADGRVVVLSHDGRTNSLLEINFTTGDWGDAVSLTASNIQSLLPAEASQPYDFLIDDGNYLIGYNLETSTQTPLLNLLESGMTNLGNYHVGFLTDGRFFTLSINHFADLPPELTIFTPTPRDYRQEEPTVLTLGGIHVSVNIRQMVTRFNRENQDYQIEIYEFGDGVDWNAGLLRFQVEMIAGRGPDIIYNAGMRDLNANFMVDLNPFIDADIEIDRADFFPNLLRALETQDGVMPFISGVSIETMVALEDTATQLYPLTFETLLERLYEVDAPHMLGSLMLRDTFLLNSILYSDNTFIDWESSQANFDNDAFIQLLNIAKTLPDEFEWVNMGEEVRRLHMREQLLYNFRFNSLLSSQMLFGILGEEITIVGMPTPTGGQNVITLWEGLGINAASPHSEAAWSFIRNSLLPGSVGEPRYLLGLPLRIDEFDAEIIELMTPNLFWEETNPETGAVEGEERPAQVYVGIWIYVYALREDEAALIREIVESADMVLRHSETIAMIVSEDTQAFFDGARAAEDTARIIQNRVQTYLNERR